MKVKKYDQVIIGSGCGLALAEELSERKYKVALIENQDMGGTCLNRGCIPSKMLLHSAESVEMALNVKDQNIEISKALCHFEALVKRVSAYVDHKAKKILSFYKDNPRIDLYRGKAVFLSSHTLQIGEEKIKGDQIFIATGARPLIPDIPGLLNTPYLTSSEALRLTKKPKDIVILGGGDIAAELGFYFAAMGSKVTVLIRSSKLLSREDEDVQKQFLSAFKEKVDVCFETDVEEVSYQEGTFFIRCKDKKSRKERKFHAEQFLLCAGVIPNTDGIGLENTKVKKDEKGFIEVNGYLQTKEKHIWALGDCTGPPFLRHLANAEVDYLLDTLFDKKHQKRMDYRFIPHAVFTYPQIAAVGKTESELKKEGISYVVGFCDYKEVARGEALKVKLGFVKLLFEKKTKVLVGAHILGEEASTLCHILIPFLMKKETVDVILKMIYIHPSLAEVVRKAALKARF